MVCKECGHTGEDFIYRSHAYDRALNIYSYACPKCGAISRTLKKQRSFRDKIQGLKYDWQLYNHRLRSDGVKGITFAAYLKILGEPNLTAK